jgi:dipeptidyl aminopeptidase/acylaminoacyl peptidase
MNADGSDLRPLGDVSRNPDGDINSSLWSPDGTRIAYQYWTYISANNEVFHPIAVVDVATGVAHDVGETHPNGYISWEWSPDGSSILEVPSDPSGGNDCSSGGCKGLKGGDILVVNATDGSVTPTSWQADTPINWQRVAPKR